MSNMYGLRNSEETVVSSKTKKQEASTLPIHGSSSRQPLPAGIPSRQRASDSKPAGLKVDEIRTYGSGAQRSHIDERWSLLPMDSLMAAARVMARGAERHGENNWRLGIPIEDVLDHAMNHIAKYLLGDRSEEHLAHALCNLCMAVHFDSQHHEGE